MRDVSRRVYNLSERNDKGLEQGLERKKEQARKRAKVVRDSAIFTKKGGGRSLTPGVKIVGSRLFDGDSEEPTTIESDLKQAVTEYLLRKGGFKITEERLIDTISKKRDSEDVMEVQIARIDGFDEKWGLTRKFLHKSLFAHRFSNGTIIEHSLISYGGFVSRTYYVVEGNNFHAFAQRNFRKTD
jgi:hypothetical protein